MKKLLKLILWIVLIVLAIIVTSPKRDLYDAFQEKAVKYSFIISQEKIKDKFLFLELNDGDIYLKDILSANFEQIRVCTLFVFSQIKLQNLKTSKNIENILSFNVEEGVVRHFFWNPFVLNLKGQGDFGEAFGQIDLREKKGVLTIIPSVKFEEIAKKLGNQIKKNEEGFYIYEFKL